MRQCISRQPGFEPGVSHVKGEKCTNALGWHLVLAYFESYSRIKQIQKEVKNSIRLVELNLTLLFKKATEKGGINGFEIQFQVLFKNSS